MFMSGCRCNTDANFVNSASQNRKWRMFNSPRSLAIFSTNNSAARRSIRSNKSSHFSARRQRATVWGLTRRLRAIAALLSISPVRNISRARVCSSLRFL